MLLFVIDAGTTTSRIRLTDGEKVLASVKRPVGARDVAITGGKQIYPGCENRVQGWSGIGR